MTARKLKTFTFLITIFSTSLVFGGKNCTPFKVHNLADPPPAPEINIPETLPVNWENALAEKIGRFKTQAEFPSIYKNWLKLHPRNLSDDQRYRWLQCLAYYISYDTDRDGVPDWSAIIDHQPAKILFAADPDQDGDGLTNMYDPQPLVKNQNVETAQVGIPHHLKFDAQKRPEESRLQQQLFREFKIIAVDHTDEHAAPVLKELLLLLQKGYSKRFVSGLMTVRYVYAFAGHSHGGRMAAYHWQAQALSFGGKSVYPNVELAPNIRLELLSAFAHEIGHAVLFEKLRANDLAEVSSHYSGWQKIRNNQLKADFFSPVLFEAFPHKEGRNFVSQYAMVNRHEWFAESMAAAVLNKLGTAGVLRPDWKATLLKPSFNNLQYWADYTRISDDFLDWFRVLMKN